MKKTLALLLSAVLFVGILAGCGQRASTSDEAAASANELNQADTIRIAVQPGTSTFILNDSEQIIEQEFADDGIEIEYIDFAGGPAIMEAIAAGEVDFAITGNLPLFTSIANGTGVEAVYRGLLDTEEMQIFTKSDSAINGIDDLIGKSIGFPVGSASHDFLVQILNDAGYNIDDVTIVNLSADDIATALDKGEIDAGILWEPQASIIRGQIDSKVVLTSDGLFEVLKLLDARTDFVTENPELTARFIKAIIQLDQATVDDPEKVQKLLADANNNSVDDWACIARYQFTGEFNDAAWSAAKKSISFLADNDLISSDFDVNLVYDGQYYERALELLEESGS